MKYNNNNNNDDDNINNINIINSNFSNVIINNLTNSSNLRSPNKINNNKNIIKNNKNVNNYYNNNINNNNLITINDNNNNNNLNNNNININNNLNNSQKICCICTKTNCIKKYCACFANGRFCENCECQNCLNTRENATTDINILQKNSIENIICNCSRSNCQKKYCECYKAGKSCGPICRCIGCLNIKNISINSFNNTPEQSSNSNNNSNNNNFDKKIKKNRLSYINHFMRNLTIDNLNVSIINGVINVIFDKINLDVQKTPKLLNRKKNRMKNESTNMKTISNINSTNIKKKKENKVAKSKKILSFK